MSQSNESAIVGDSFKQKVEEHLTQALDADTPETKNYHIRSALQLCVVAEVSTGVEQSQME